VRGVLRTPSQTRAALVVQRREQQPAEQTHVLEELDSVHAALPRIVDLPEGVPGERRRHQRAGQQQRHWRRGMTGSQQHPAGDLAAPLTRTSVSASVVGSGGQRGSSAPADR